MERATWTEERLDDLAESMRTGFARIDQDMRELRSEFKSEMHEFRAEVKGEIGELRQTMLRAGAGLIGTMMLGFLSVIAALLANGA